MATETDLKHTLFKLFGASKHPTQGHVWDKIDKFRNPTEFSQLKNHPLYGIKGWALALLIWLVVSAVFGVFVTHVFGYSLKLMNPRAFAQLEDHYTFELVAAWFVLGWSCVTAYLLWTKDEEFHMSFFYQLVTVIVLQIITRLSYDNTGVRATGVVRAFMLLIIFVPLLWYSFRSKRIAVTCAGMLRHDDPFLHRLRGRDMGGSDNVTTSDADRQTPSEPISTVTQDDEDEEFYKQVWDEWERDEIDNGLRAKAFVESGGNDEKTKAIYLKLRVQQLGRQRREDLAEKRRVEGERRAKAEKLRQEQAEKLRREKEEQLRRENEKKRQEEGELARKEAKHQAALVKVRTENKRKKWRLIRRTLYGATLGGYLLIAIESASTSTSHLTESQLIQIQNQIKISIKNSWSKKFGFGVDPANLRSSVVSVEVRGNGTVENVRLVESSGDTIFDDSAIIAVLKAAPFDLRIKIPKSKAPLDLNLQFHPTK